MPENLYRRSSGIYVVRIVIPRRLRQAVGRAEVHTSTGHRHLAAAKLAALEIQLAWRKKLMEIDRAKLESANPLLLSGGLMSLSDAASAIGIPLTALLTELFNDRASLFVQAQDWPGWWVPDIHDIERDYDGTFVINDIETKGSRQLLTGLSQPFDISSFVVSLKTGPSTVSALRLEGVSAFFVDEPKQVNVEESLVPKSTIERIRSRLAALLPPAAVTPAAAPYLTIGDSAAVIYDPITAKHGTKRFLELFDLYRNDRQWGEDQKRRMATEARLFAELMDNPELVSIERETVLEYAKRLAALPSDIYLTGRRYKTNSLAELTVIARNHNLELKNESTVKRHIGHLSEILNYGVKNQMLRFNPAADFKRGKSHISIGSAKSDRDVFDENDLNAIFSAEWFRTGAGVFEAKGWTDWRPFNYWLPIMGLLTGGRINELSQLYLDDLVQSKTGIWYFDFNLIQPDKADADALERDKSLKTVNAIRIVPMHNILVQLGLPEYAAALREAGNSRLFPELTRDKIKGYGKPAGSWFNERFLGKRLGIERNGRKVFHSFRHLFATSLERLDVSESVRAQLAGHVRGKTESGTRYAKDRNAEELFPIVNGLRFACLEKVARFDISAGLKALKVSQRFKQSMARGKLSRESNKA